MMLATRSVLIALLAFPIATAAGNTTAPTGGLVNPDDLHTEPYVDFPRSDLDNAFHGQTPGIGGYSNSVTMTLGNPFAFEVPVELGVQLREDGAQQQQPRPGQQGQPFVEPPWTTTNLTLPAHGKLTRIIQATPAADSRGVQIQVRLNGKSAAWSGSTTGGTRLSVLPPIHVTMTSPAPTKGLATIGQLSGGGGGFSGVPIAFASTTHAVRFTAHVHNDASTEASFRLRISSDQGGGTGQLVNVDALPGGGDRDIDLGTVDPAKLDPDAARNGGLRIFPFSVSFLHTDDKADAFAPTAADYTIVNGLVTALAPAGVALGLRHEFAVDAIAPATAKLGEIVGINLIASQFGSTDESNNKVIVTLDPPFNAEYSVQGAQATTYYESVAAGASHTRALPFQPLVAGRWAIVVQWNSANGPNNQATSVFTIDVPTDIDVSVIGTDGARPMALGGTTTAEVQLKALRALHGATLRLTTGTKLSTNGGGGDGPQLAVSGLSASVVTASPTELPLGDINEGESRFTNITVTSAGTGDFNVVPYVVAGGYAYTGIPPVTAGSHGAPSVASVANGPVFEVLVKPTATTPAIAFVPAAVVLVLGVGAHFARKKFVR